MKKNDDPKVLYSKNQSTDSLIQLFQDKLTPERKERLDAIIANRSRHFTLVLEDLKDPHNISAVIRTSEVFGFQDVHIIEELNAYSVSKQILKGSFKWLSLMRYKSRLRCMQNLREKGYQIAVASTNTQTPLREVDFSKPTAFYMGSESLGNHPETLKQADVHFFIPQYGVTESMNVSVCAGVLMSTLRNWMEDSKKDYGLSDSEIKTLRGDFYQRSVLGVEVNSPLSFVE